MQRECALRSCVWIYRSSREYKLYGMDLGVSFRSLLYSWIVYFQFTCFASEQERDRVAVPAHKQAHTMGGLFAEVKRIQFFDFYLSASFPDMKWCDCRWTIHSEWIAQLMNMADDHRFCASMPFTVDIQNAKIWNDWIHGFMRTTTKDCARNWMRQRRKS